MKAHGVYYNIQGVTFNQVVCLFVRMYAYVVKT